MTGFRCAACVFMITAAFFIHPTITDPDDYQGIAWSSTPGNIFVIQNTDATFNWTHTVTGPYINIAWSYKGTKDDRELTYILGFSNNALYVPISDRSPRLDYLNFTGSAIMILKNVTLEDMGIYEAKVVDLDEHVSGNPQYISNDATLNIIPRSELMFTVTIGDLTFDLSVALNGTSAILPDLETTPPTQLEVRVIVTSSAPNPTGIMIQNRFGDMMYTDHSCVNAHKCQKQIQCTESQAADEQANIVIIINFDIQHLDPIYVTQTVWFTDDLETVTGVHSDPPARPVTTGKTIRLLSGISGFLNVAIVIAVFVLCRKRKKQRHVYSEVRKADVEFQEVPRLPSYPQKNQMPMFPDQQYDHLYEVSHLTKFIIPPHQITCAEYCFSVVVDFEIEHIEDPGITHLNQILTALLNTSGGIIRIRNNTNQVPSQRTMALWRGKSESVLSEFVPDDIYDKFVQLSTKKYPMEVLVKKSDVLVTLTSHMCVRRSTGNKNIRDIRSIHHVMSRSSSSPAALPFDHKSLKYGTSVKVKQGDEYIYWETVHRFETEHIISLLALANLPSGGYAIVGMNTNLTSGGNKVVGRVTSADEEAKLSHFIGRSLRKDDRSRCSRIWGNINKTPERGTDWDIKFIPVDGDPTRQRSCVIVIHMRHCLGGVWVTCPESFLISETGHVLEMNFDAWKTALTNTLIQEVGISEFTASENEERGELSPYDSNAGPSSELVEARGTRAKQVDDFLKNKEYLSFSEHSVMSYKGTTFGKTTEYYHNIREFAYESCVLKLTNPMNLTPDRESVILSQADHRQQITGAIRHIETTRDTHMKSFGIVSSTWAREIQSRSQLEVPDGHLLDVFVMDEDGCMDLWTIVDEEASGYSQRKTAEHTYLTGRMLKRNILLDQYHCRSLGLTFISCIWVKCCLYGVKAGKEISHTNSSEYCEYFISGQRHIQGVKLCLARIFLKKDTRIRSIFGDELSFTLTSEQVETIFRIELSKFNYIEGPPGSGKTYIALHICRKYRDYGYICGTSTFKTFLAYQGLNDDRIFCIANENDLKTQIRKGNFNDIEYLIYDDFQNTPLGEDLCLRLFDYVAESDRTKLIIFGDSQYQRFSESDALVHLQNYCQKSKIRLTDMKLTQIHRNTRKVSMFIKSNFEEHTHISCSHQEDGDDVEVRRLENVTSEELAQNGLVSYVKSIVDPQKLVDNARLSYEPKEVGILVDTIDCAATTEKLRTIFKTMWEDSVHIQDAGTFPVTGLTIDTLDNFMGFDRKVCILVCDEGIERSDQRSGHSLSNPRYRCFVASRGTAKVVFVVTSELNSNMAAKFNFDNIPLEPIHRWSIQAAAYDICWLPLNQTSALLYVPWHAGIRLVSLEGDHMDLNMDISDIGQPGSVSSSRDGQTVIVLDCHSPYKWTVYGKESRQSYVRLGTYSIQWKPISVRLDSAGDILVVVHEFKEKKSCLRKYSPADGRLLWEKSVNAAYLHPGSLTTDHSDRAYVCEGKIISVHNTNGDLIRTVSVPEDIGSIIALCVDSSGQWMFAGDKEGKVSLFHKGKLIRRHLIVGEDKWMHSLCLYRDTYLGVASRNMLHVYDIKGVLIRNNIVV